MNRYGAASGLIGRYYGIIGGTSFKDDGKVCLDRVGTDNRAARSHLFLAGEVSNKVDLQLCPLQLHEGGKGACATDSAVERLADEQAVFLIVGATDIGDYRGGYADPVVVDDLFTAAGPYIEY